VGDEVASVDGVRLVEDGTPGAPRTLVLAHGAGAPSSSPFLDRIARGLAERGIRVVRFDFPYMERRASGRRGPPDPERVLRERWLEVVEAVGGGPRVAIGGKSLGGRIASLVADEARVRALVCLGYPFHPPGRPDRLRTAHLAELATPTLIVQGSRDPFGTRDEIATYDLSPAIRVEFLEAGDHSFKPPKSSGHTLDAHLTHTLDTIATFLP
jgi:predicted alpha/beta-hydrolase family hydrolase